jgi:hypothetical protein
LSHSIAHCGLEHREKFQRPEAPKKLSLKSSYSGIPRAPQTTQPGRAAARIRLSEKRSAM